MKHTLRPDPESLVGAVGVAVTDLKPQGRVSVRGFAYDAHTAGVYYPAGTEVVVVDVDHLGLMVRVPLDNRSLDALVRIERPKRTPRWRWWEKERACDAVPSTLDAVVACVKVALVVLIIVAVAWSLLRLLLG